MLGKEIPTNTTKKTILSGLKQSTMYRVKVNAFSYVGEGEINFVEVILGHVSSDDNYRVCFL